MLKIISKCAFPAALLSAIACPSAAADLGSLKDPNIDALPVKWAGFYAGVNAGGVSNNNRTAYSYGYAPGNGTGNFSDFFGSAADNTPNGSSSAGPLNISGLNAVQSAEAEGFLPLSLGLGDRLRFIGGGQLGYNWQRGALVLGGEADIAWTGDNSASRFSATIPNAYTNAGLSQSQVDWLGTARLRAGYAIDRLLPYVTGGLAFGGTKSSSHSAGTDGETTDTFSGSSSGTRAGWTVGGGLDYWLTNRWTFRVEGFY